MFSVDAAAVTSMNMRNSCNDLQPEHAAALQIQLSHFPALKHIDVSRNPGLRLLPVSLLHIAAGIETFNCIECSLRLPAQSFFSESEEASCLLQNSRNIQALINGSHTFFDQILDFSGLDLMPSQASEIAYYLRFYKNVERLDISRNPTLSRGGATTILSALEGTSPSHSEKLSRARASFVTLFRCRSVDLKHLDPEPLRYKSCECRRNRTAASAVQVTRHRAPGPLSQP